MKFIYDAQIGKWVQVVNGEVTGFMSNSEHANYVAHDWLVNVVLYHDWQYLIQSITGSVFQ